MGWSIQQVARMSGVTARTLRYYDEIGLLPPARTGANGHRWYEQPELLRLQQVLILRALGLDLGRIAAVVNGEHDPVEALRHHHRRLLAEHDRLARLAQTVARTIERLEGGATVPAEELFDGFRFTRETLTEREAAATEQELPYYAAIRDRTRDWTDADFRAAEEAGAQTERRLLALLREGAAADDPAVFAVLDDDLAEQRRIWSPSREEYTRLGAAFAAAPDLRAHLDRRDPGLADFMCAAMAAYAQARLG